MKIKQLLDIKFQNYEEAIAVVGTDRVSIVIPQEISLHPPAKIDPELDMLPRSGGMFNLSRIDLRLRGMLKGYQFRVESYDLPTYIPVEEAIATGDVDSGIVDRLQQLGYCSPSSVEGEMTRLDPLFRKIAAVHESCNLSIERLFPARSLDPDRRTNVEGDFLLSTGNGVFLGFINHVGSHLVICQKDGNRNWEWHRLAMKSLVVELALQECLHKVPAFYPGTEDYLARHIRNGGKCWEINNPVYY